MVQSNVIVTYAPARRASAPAPERNARTRQPRWGITLAGALLAGGAVFALGQFVRPDGSLRETALPPGKPMASAGRIAIPPAARPDREADPAKAEPAPLPYLALVRDTEPFRVTPERRLSATTRGEVAPTAPSTSLLDAIDPPAAVRVETIIPPPPPSPPLAARQRQDLEGFLSEQGLVLAAPAPDVSREAPVSEWTVEEVAATQRQDPTAATAPPSGSESVLELTKSEDLPASTAPAETPGMATAETAAEFQTEQLAAVEPPVDTTPAAPPPETMSPGQQPALGKTAPPTALAAAPAQPAMTAAPAPAYAQLFPMAVVNGQALGAVTMRDLGAEGMAVHLGALVGLLKLRMPLAEFERLSSAAAAEQFVTLDQLRNAGISVEYDEQAGRLLIEAR